MFSKDRGVFKAGNGAEYIQFLEKKAQKKNLKEMGAYMNTRENLFYTKLRDDINDKQRRLYNLKQREVDQQNEKMFGKLMSILNRENDLKSKHKPGSLNMAQRRRSVNAIN